MPEPRINEKLRELEAIQRELHATYRQIRFHGFRPERYDALLAAITREGELRQSIRAWLDWQVRERRPPYADAG